MSIQSLRTFDDPFYTMTTALDGSDYLLEFRYNQREAAWYVNVSLSDGTLLAAGVKIVCNRPLLVHFSDERLPPGVLVAYANSTDASVPGLTELGEDRRVTLLYYSASELA
jgi:hypothetical protein